MASTPTDILITRHGISEHNMNTRVFMGRAPESRLTELGREQARLLGRRLAGGARMDRIVCSSLPRTRETAEIIAAVAGVENIHPDDRFWELNKGVWEGVMPRDLPPEEKRQVERAPFDFQFGGAESYRDVVARCGPAFVEWTERHRGERILFVLHGDVIRALLFYMIRFPEDKISDFAVDPCSLTEVSEQNGRYLITRVNDASHLTGY